MSNVLVQPFLALPVFQGLSSFQISEIARRADRVVFEAGDLLIETGKLGDAALIIFSGEAVSIEEDSSGPGRVVPEGSMLAELAMFVESRHNSTVIARTRIKALRLSRNDMHALMLEERTLAEHFADKIHRRLVRLAKEMRQVEDQLGTAIQNQTLALDKFDQKLLSNEPARSPQ